MSQKLLNAANLRSVSFALKHMCTSKVSSVEHLIFELFIS